MIKNIISGPYSRFLLLGLIAAVGIFTLTGFFIQRRNAPNSNTSDKNLQSAVGAREALRLASEKMKTIDATAFPVSFGLGLSSVSIDGVFDPVNGYSKRWEAGFLSRDRSTSYSISITNGQAGRPSTVNLGTESITVSLIKNLKPINLDSWKIGPQDAYSNALAYGGNLYLEKFKPDRFNLILSQPKSGTEDRPVWQISFEAPSNEPKISDSDWEIRSKYKIIYIDAYSGQVVEQSSDFQL